MFRVFTDPVRKHPFIIAVIAICVLFAPQVALNDYQLNIEPLVNLNRVYEDPAYVYPPHALSMMSPFLLVGASGTRALTVVLVGMLGSSRGWSVRRFFAAILNPIFVYAMLFSNLDLFLIVLPVLFYRRSHTLLRSLLLAGLMLKPQMGAFLALYYVVRLRSWKAALIGATFTLIHFVIPDSSGIALGVQWIDNLLNPTDYNVGAWTMNPVGPRWLIFVVLPLVYYLRRASWTEDRTIASILIVTMSISPYASFQSVLAPITLLSSFPLTFAQWGIAAFEIIGIIWYFLTALLLGDQETSSNQPIRSNS